MPRLSEPRIVERGPCLVAGAYATFEGDDEGPGWAAADAAFRSRADEITDRVDGSVLGFLYRPHVDHSEVPPDVRACFVGVEVADAAGVPQGLALTRFSGGSYAVVDAVGDDPGEAAEGVGLAIADLAERWVPAHGFVEGDACFAAGDPAAPAPPFVETVWMKVERPG